jgi:hypothetical protein
MIRLARKHGIDDRSAERALRVVSPLAAPPLIPKERLFLYAGTGDRMSRPEQAHRLWEHWDRPEIVWYDGSHMTFLWSRVVIEFLDRTLRATGFVASPIPKT